MKEFTLTVVDTSGIQDYIFSSNNLKQIVGASGLVYAAGNDWAYDILAELGKTNVRSGVFDERLSIERDDLKSELIYCGGGNTVILFATRPLAIEFTRRLTKKVMLVAPGLNLVVAHTDFDWEDSRQPLREVLQKTIEHANQRKRNRPFSMPLLGLGVTADCRYTDLPAVGRDIDGRLISAVGKAKLDYFNDAQKRLSRVIPSEYRAGNDFVQNFDEFGDEGQSYLAVVHTDGNGLGRRVQKLSERDDNRNNRHFIREMRAFARSIEETATEAIQLTVQALTFIRDGKIGGKVNIQHRRLPIRPIVFGGDDATFVCDGRLGLTLAQIYLHKLTAKELSDGQPLAARAGIAIVKRHYPFARAYSLAEDLNRSAKKFLRERNRYTDSALDWHFSTSGPVLGLEQIRAREFTEPQGSLISRPVFLSNPVEWRTWDTFASQVRQLQDPQAGWGKHKNQLMALREVSRQGPAAVQHYRTMHKLPELPAIPAHPETVNTGWLGDFCTCFDPIEALDFFVEL